MTRHAEAELYNKYAVFVRGYGTRDALVAVVGRAPVWSTQHRAWVCSERTSVSASCRTSSTSTTP